MIGSASHRWLALFLTLGLASASGCFSSESGPPKYAVSGTVQYKGTPVKDGAIVFFPTQAGGGMQDGVKIVDGKFNGQATAGPKRVFIEASRPGRKVKDEEGNEHVELEWYIPAKYNERSELTYEVMPETNSGMDFQLD